MATQKPEPVKRKLLLHVILSSNSRAEIAEDLRFFASQIENTKYTSIYHEDSFKWKIHNTKSNADRTRDGMIFDITHFVKGE